MTRTNIPRLYVGTALTRESTVTIEGPQAHYLKHVMRLREGEEVRLFNGVDGEWLTVVEQLGKKALSLAVSRQTRPQTATPDVRLVFAPIKSTHGDFLVQKATELGVRRLSPVRTDRTVVTRVSLEKMHLHVVEAAEQSERLDVPGVDPMVSLQALLGEWDASRALLYGDESGGGAHPSLALAGKAPPLALLIGPEGGFSPQEFALLRSLPFALPLSLGERILRADTAALAGLTLIAHYLQ